MTRRVKINPYRDGLNSRLVLNSIYNGILSIDTEGFITYLNKTAERILGVFSDELLNRSILDVLPNMGGKLLECLKKGCPFHGEKIEDQKVNIISNIDPIFIKGKILGAVSVFEDLLEIENISKQLDLFKNMKNWLDGVIDSSYDGLWICDNKGQVVRINKASERISGVKAEEVVGKNMRELVAEGLFDKSVTFEVLRKRASVTMIQRVRGEKSVLVTGNPIFDEQNRIAFVVTNDRDITELDSLRNQLEVAQILAKGYLSQLSELQMKDANIGACIFRSKAMGKVLETAFQVAKVNSTVLLLGQSGVGKGLIAKIIHRTSDRSSGPFICVDCAAIPSSLFESELFGYEKGAFTGANFEGKPGFIELANKGILFLDEIGELPLSSQSKLLRFLENHEVIRVGGTSLKQIDTRVIAATNKDLDQLLARKEFREDLYYRLSVIPIYIPPLRERKEDILPLTFHFLEKFNNIYHKKKIFSANTLEAFSQYDFPGNVRELANHIERLVVTEGKDRIDVTELPDVIRRNVSNPMAYPFSPEGASLKEALEKHERAVIEETIEKYGSQREAAKALKVDQSTISRKAKKYSIWNKDDVILHK